MVTTMPGASLMLVLSVALLIGFSRSAHAQATGKLQVGARVVRAETSVDPRARAAQWATNPGPVTNRQLWSLQRDVRREGRREQVLVTLNFLAN